MLPRKQETPHILNYKVPVKYFSLYSNWEQIPTNIALSCQSFSHNSLATGDTIILNKSCCLRTFFSYKVIDLPH